MAEIGAGWILADRYRLESLLGQGGMGSVWKAHHVTLNSPVAIKLMDPDIASSELGIERFVREAQAAAALRSPHVVQTLDFGVHEGVPYIAMELMQGESLAERLQRQGKLSPAETTRVLTHVGRAVAKAHDMGIIHRDLKPDNIFLVHNDDEEIAKVLDFGIAKLADSSGRSFASTRTGALIGTPYYMSPEQAEGIKLIDHRTDIWAMGVIAYECLLGRRPFDGDAIGELILRICTRPMPIPSSVGPVPVGFDAWFERACARALDQRFSTVREMTDALRSLVTGADELVGSAGADELVGSAAAGDPVKKNNAFWRTTTPVVETTEYAAPRPKRAPWFVATGVAVVVVGLVGAYAFVAERGASSASSASASTPSTAVATSPADVPHQPIGQVAPSASTEVRERVQEPNGTGDEDAAEEPKTPAAATPRKTGASQRAATRTPSQPTANEPRSALQVPKTVPAPESKPAARAKPKPRPTPSPKPTATRDPLGTR